MNKPTNILFSGVGGQGIILASDITAIVLMRSGLDVKKSEIHGMAQRGGSVIAHLRFGEKIHSPVIEKGTTDLLVSFEMLESVRCLPYMKRKGTVILNTQKIPPLSVSTGAEQYPSNIDDQLRDHGLEVKTVNALETAQSLGEIRTVNMVMTGVLSHFLPVDEHVFKDVIRERIKKQFIEVNLEAFHRGREIIGYKEKQTSRAP